MNYNTRTLGDMEIDVTFFKFLKTLHVFFISSCMHENNHSKHTHGIVLSYQLHLVRIFFKSDSNNSIREYGIHV